MSHLSSQPPEITAENLSQSPRSAGSAWAREKRFADVLGPRVAPADLEDYLFACRVSRGGDPRALAARQIRLPQLELPLRCDLLDHAWERGKPLESLGKVILADRIGKPRRNPNRHVDSVAAEPKPCAPGAR